MRLVLVGVGKNIKNVVEYKWLCGKVGVLYSKLKIG